MTRRSTGKTHIARAIWYPRKGVAELQPGPLPRLQPGQALVRTLFSSISRGTERLVFNGAVSQSEWERMRAPHQEGAFSFPVKYGYCRGITSAHALLPVGNRRRSPDCRSARFLMNISVNSRSFGASRIRALERIRLMTSTKDFQRNTRPGT